MKTAFRKIAIQRTECFGACPSYEATIEADGSVSYYGGSYCDKKGRHTWILSEEEVQRINEWIDEADFTSFQYKEPMKWATCGASCIIQIDWQDGRSHKTDNYHNCNSFPPELWVFECRLEALCGIDKYVGKKRLQGYDKARYQ